MARVKTARITRKKHKKILKRELLKGSFFYVWDIIIEKMKKDIEVIAGEYITIEGDGDIQKATKLVAEKGIVPPTLQKDLDRIAGANIPKDIFFKQGTKVLGL